MKQKICGCKGDKYMLDCACTSLCKCCIWKIDGICPNCQKKAYDDTYVMIVRKFYEDEYGFRVYDDDPDKKYGGIEWYPGIICDDPREVQPVYSLHLDYVESDRPVVNLSGFLRFDENGRVYSRYKTYEVEVEAKCIPLLSNTSIQKFTSLDPSAKRLI